MSDKNCYKMKMAGFRFAQTHDKEEKNTKKNIYESLRSTKPRAQVLITNFKKIHKKIDYNGRK